MKNDKIDFVITWVDGSDPAWINEKNKYSNINGRRSADKIIARYRDWDNLKYWFRGVEKFAPWVNKIHFVTCGQVPDWLNRDCDKLNLVNHTDFIPSEYLPTFSSHVIELNLHRIDGLAERFVYFNDDTFLLKPTNSDLFFSNSGLPKYRAAINAIVPGIDGNDIMAHVNFNIMKSINKHFAKNQVIRGNIGKWFNWHYGPGLMVRTLLNLPYSGFTGMYFDHLPVPCLKSTYDKLWTVEKELLNSTSYHKFRNKDDVNQYILRAWQICEGEFSPLRVGRHGKAYFLSNDCRQICHSIENQKYNMVCINDSEKIDNFDELKTSIAQSFETILPDKSSFEL